MKEIKIKLTLRGESKALAKVFADCEERLCKTRCSFNYQGIVYNYVEALSLLADMQGRHFNQAKAYKLVRRFNKQSTAQKAIRDIERVYVLG